MLPTTNVKQIQIFTYLRHDEKSLPWARSFFRVPTQKVLRGHAEMKPRQGKWKEHTMWQEVIVKQIHTKAKKEPTSRPALSLYRVKFK